MPSSIWEPQVAVVDAQLRANLARTDNEEFGSGLIGHNHELAYDDGTVGAALNLLQEEIATVSYAITDGYLNVTSLGADPTGVEDSLPAFEAALLQADRIYIPVGVYLLSDTLHISRSDVKILGASRLKSQLVNTTADTPTLQIATGVDNLDLANFTLRHQSIATVGGDGLAFSSITRNTRLTDIESRDNWNGFSLRGSWLSAVTNCLATNNYNNGIQLSSDSSGLLAWDLRNCVAAYNNANGILIQATDHGSDLAHTLGGITGCYSLYNSGTGLRAVGVSASRLASVRASAGAISYNGDHNIYLDSFAQRHHFSGINIIAAGATPTGRQGEQIPASLAGSGIHITNNNGDTSIVNCSVYTNYYAGIYTAGSRTSAVGNSLVSNGLNTGANYMVRSGIQAVGGVLLATGNNAYNQAGLATQQTGISISSAGAGTRIVGNALTGNVYTLVINTIASVANPPEYFV